MEYLVLETADAHLFRYRREDEGLRKLLVEARKSGNDEIMEELDCEYNPGEPE